MLNTALSLAATMQNITIPARGTNIPHSPFTTANGRRVGHYDYTALIPHHEQGRSKEKKVLANHDIRIDKLQTKPWQKGKGKTFGIAREKAHIRKAEVSGHPVGATRSGNTQRRQGAEVTPERKRTGRNSKNANKHLLAKDFVLIPGKKYQKKHLVEQDMHYRAKRNIQSSVETLPTNQKVGGCITNQDHVLELQDGFSKQEKVLEKNLKEHFEKNKQVLLKDIEKDNGLRSIVNKLERNVEEILAGHLDFDPKYYTELGVISCSEYESYFSPTIEITLPEVERKEIEKVTVRAKNIRKEAKSMSHCVDEIRKEAASQKLKIKQLVKKTADDLNRFLSDTYESDFRARYESLKTKIFDIAKSERWAIPTQFYQFTDCPTTINRSASDSPATAAPSTADLSTADPSTADPSTADLSTADPSTADLSTADPSTADPSTADLSTADRTTTGLMTTADRTTADLSTADRTTADRTTAGLSTADLSTADLSTADRTTAGLMTTADRTTADLITEKPTYRKALCSKRYIYTLCCGKDGYEKTSYWATGTTRGGRGMLGGCSGGKKSDCTAESKLRFLHSSRKYKNIQSFCHSNDWGNAVFLNRWYTADPSKAGPSTADPSTADLSKADRTTTGLMTTAGLMITADRTTAGLSTADLSTADRTTTGLMTTAGLMITADRTTAGLSTADLSTADLSTADLSTAELTTAGRTTAGLITEKPTYRKALCSKRYIYTLCCGKDGYEKTSYWATGTTRGGRGMLGGCSGGQKSDCTAESKLRFLHSSRKYKNIQSFCHRNDWGDALFLNSFRRPLHL